jgi:hypothetical protein
MNAPVKIKNQRSAPQDCPNEIRVAYPYFHEKREKNAAGIPYTRKDGTPHPRYSATLLFPKLSNDPSQCANYAWLWSLAVEAAQKMWPQNVDAAGKWLWPQGAQLAIKDGDIPYVTKPKPGQPLPTADEVAAKNAWRKGYWCVEVENFLNPGPHVLKVVNGQRVVLPTKLSVSGVAEYKGGDFGFVNMHAWAYQNETFGVNYGFDAFMFTREGEVIGNNSGPRSAAQMFGGVTGTVASTAPAMPGAAPLMPGPQYAAPVAPAAPMAPAPVYAAPLPTAAPLAPVYAPPAPTYAAPPAPPLAPAAPTAPGMAPLPPFPAPVR